MSDFKLLAESIWLEMERARGTYHPNDREAYIGMVEAALKKASVLRIPGFSISLGQHGGYWFQREDGEGMGVSIMTMNSIFQRYM